MNDLLTGGIASYYELGDALKGLLTLLVLSSVRVYALTSVFPPAQSPLLVGPVRNGMCLLIGLYIAWGQPTAPFAGMSFFAMALLIVKEVVIGLLLGFAAAVPFWIASGVGALVDNMAGFNNQQMSNPLGGEASTPVSNLLQQLAAAVFWMLGGALFLVGALIQSYHWWPLGRLTLSWSAVLEDFAAVHLTQYATQIVTIAAPVLLMLLLIDLGFGVIAKTAEKLEPNMMAQPVKGAVATVMLAVMVAVYFHEVQPQLALKNFATEIEGWVRSASTGR